MFSSKIIVPIIIVFISLPGFAQHNNVLYKRINLSFRIYLTEGNKPAKEITENVYLLRGFPADHYKISLKIYNLPNNWYYSIWFTDSLLKPSDSISVITTEHKDSITFFFTPISWFETNKPYCLRITPLGYGASNWWYSSKPFIINDFYFTKNNRLLYLAVNSGFFLLTIVIMFLGIATTKRDFGRDVIRDVLTRLPDRFLLLFIVLYFVISYVCIGTITESYGVQNNLYEKVEYCGKYIFEAVGLFSILFGVLLFVVSSKEKKNFSTALLDKLFIQLKEFDHGEFKYKALVNLELLMRNYQYDSISGGGIKLLVLPSLERVSVTVIPALKELLNLCKLLRFDKEFSGVYRSIVLAERETTRVERKLKLYYNKILNGKLNHTEALLYANELLNFRKSIKYIFSSCLAYYRIDVIRVISSEKQHWLQSGGDKIKILIESEQTELNCIFSKNEFADILSTLIQNSIDSISQKSIPQGTIQIKLEKQEDRGVIIITDDGTGIQVKPLERIFELGVSTKGKKRGVGLFLVKTLIERYFGTIEVYSDESGTTFIIKLLLADNV